MSHRFSRSFLKVTLGVLCSLGAGRAQDLAYESGSTGADGAFILPEINNLRELYGGMAAYDPSRQEVIVFGGAYYANYNVNQTVSYDRKTWTWDGTNWVDRGAFVATGGIAMYGGMAFDPQAGETIQYGGNVPGFSTQSQRTWAWDGTTWVARATTAVQGPRGYMGMATDFKNGEVIMFGGFTGSATSGGTYAWVSSNNTWVAKSPASSPSARHYVEMCWDGAREEIVLFGGYDGSAPYLGDTWVYKDGEWTEKFPANVPPPRYAANMGYDPVSQKVVMHGGWTGTGYDRHADCWTWDGTNWTEVTLNPALVPVADACVVTDTRRNELLMIGGRDSRYGANNSSWRWDAPTTNWVQIAGSHYTVDLNTRPDGVFHYTSINIPTGITVDFINNSNNTPVVWLATDDVVIDGGVSVDGWNAIRMDNIPSNRAPGGPGGFAGGLGGHRVEIYNTLSGTPGEGPGGGAPGITSNISGGNGRYQGVYGNEYVIPLLGGSGGGGGAAFGATEGGNGGGGGGVILIASSRDITVNGLISATGGYAGLNVSHNGRTGGHGSGGAIKLVADRIHGSGQIKAMNATGGTVGGVGGYVRLESYLRSFDIAGTVSAGQRSNAAPIAGVNYGLVPSLVVSNVAGAGVAQPPSGSFSSPDVVFSDAGTVSITVTATNIPDGTDVTLQILHSAGTISLPAVALAGGEAVFSAAVPAGLGTIQAFATYDVTP